MFELDSKTPNTIVKFNGNGRFVELSQAFQIGKIKFAFRVYDDNRPQGKRITSSLDCYIDIDEAVALADRCVSRDLFTIAGKKEEIRIKGNYKYAKPSYENYSGSTKAGPGRNMTVSRHLTISRKAGDDPLFSKLPFTLMVEQRPGKVSRTGAIIADPGANNAEYIAVGLTAEDIVRLGLQLQRACRIYDLWLASDTLQQHIEQLEVVCSKEYRNNAKKQQTNGDTFGNVYYGNSYNTNVPVQASAPSAGYVANNRQIRSAMYG